MRTKVIAADYTPSLADLRHGVILLVVAAVEITLPPLSGEDFVAQIKALVAGVTVISTAGLEVGEYATGGDPVTLTETTSAVTLSVGEYRRYVWSGSRPKGWVLLDRSCPPSTLRLSSSEFSLIGTGDGTAVNFDLPSSGLAAVYPFVNGAPVAPSAYSVSAGAGTGGVDRLVFGTAPTTGHQILAICFKKTAA
jgi:hypothetical protein